VNARISDPVRSEQQGVDFLKDLIESVDMKIIKGPFASYVNKEGNRGLTGVVMIETSHAAFHIWDERPGLIQFDLYTCGELDFEKVIALFKTYFDVKSLDYVLFDRENGFVVEKSGQEVI
jgi:S-adenosylmethionine/arginine decarboxylase-like enzyme